MMLVSLKPAVRSFTEERYDPVKLLWAQVLKRALFDYVILQGSRDLKDRRLFLSAKNWLFSEDFGLSDICKMLDWPKEKIRRRAEEMTKKDIKKMEFRERDPLPLVDSLDGDC
jgi:hypothetical protein